MASKPDHSIVDRVYDRAIQAMGLSPCHDCHGRVGDQECMSCNDAGFDPFPDAGRLSKVAQDGGGGDGGGGGGMSSGGDGGAPGSGPGGDAYGGGAPDTGAGGDALGVGPEGSGTWKSQPPGTGSFGPEQDTSGGQDCPDCGDRCYSFSAANSTYWNCARCGWSSYPRRKRKEDESQADDGWEEYRDTEDALVTLSAKKVAMRGEDCDWCGGGEGQCDECMGDQVDEDGNKCAECRGSGRNEEYDDTMRSCDYPGCHFNVHEDHGNEIDGSKLPYGYLDGDFLCDNHWQYGGDGGGEGGYSVSLKPDARKALGLPAYKAPKKAPKKKKAAAPDPLGINAEWKGQVHGPSKQKDPDEAEEWGSCQYDDGEPAVTDFLDKKVCDEHLRYALQDAPKALEKAQQGVKTTTGIDRISFENAVQKIKKDIDRGHKTLNELSLKDELSQRGVAIAKTQETKMKCGKCGVQATYEAATKGGARGLLCDEHAASFKVANDAVGIVSKVFPLHKEAQSIPEDLPDDEDLERARAAMHEDGDHSICDLSHKDHKNVKTAAESSPEKCRDCGSKPTHVIQRPDLGGEDFGKQYLCGKHVDPYVDNSFWNVWPTKASSDVPGWLREFTQAEEDGTIEKEAALRCPECEGSGTCTCSGAGGCGDCEGTGLCSRCHGDGIDLGPEDEYESDRYVARRTAAFKEAFFEEFSGSEACPGCTTTRGTLARLAATATDEPEEGPEEKTHEHDLTTPPAGDLGEAVKGKWDELEQAHPWARVVQCPGCGQGHVTCTHPFHGDQPPAFPLPSNPDDIWSPQEAKFRVDLEGGYVPEKWEAPPQGMEVLPKKKKDLKALEGEGMVYHQTVKEPGSTKERRFVHETAEEANASHQRALDAGLESELEPVQRQKGNHTEQFHDISPIPAGSDPRPKDQRRTAQVVTLNEEPKEPAVTQLKGSCVRCGKDVVEGDASDFGDDTWSCTNCAPLVGQNLDTYKVANRDEVIAYLYENDPEEWARTAQNLGCPNCEGSGSSPDGKICQACFGTGHGGGLMLKGGSADPDFDAWHEKGSWRCNHRGCLNDDIDEIYDHYGIYAGRYCSEHEKEAPGQWDYAGADTEPLDEDYPNPQRSLGSKEGQAMLNVLNVADSLMGVAEMASTPKCGRCGSLAHGGSNCPEAPQANSGPQIITEASVEAPEGVTEGIIEGDDGSTYHTTDGGQTWDKVGATEHTKDQDEEDDDIKIFKFDHGPGQGKDIVHSEIHQQEHIARWASVRSIDAAGTMTGSGCGRCGREGHTSESCSSNKGHNMTPNDDDRHLDYAAFKPQTPENEVTAALDEELMKDPYDLPDEELALDPFEAAPRKRKKAPSKAPKGKAKKDEEETEDEKKTKKVKEVGRKVDKGVSKATDTANWLLTGQINPGSGPIGTSVHDLVDNVPDGEPFPSGQRPFITDHKGEVESPGNGDGDDCRFCGEPMQDHAQWNPTSQPGGLFPRSGSWEEIGWMDEAPVDNRPKRGELGKVAHGELAAPAYDVSLHEPQAPRIGTACQFCGIGGDPSLGAVHAFSDPRDPVTGRIVAHKQHFEEYRASVPAATATPVPTVVQTGEGKGVTINIYANRDPDNDDA